MNSQTESLSASANCVYIKSWFKDTFFKLFYLNPYSFTFLCFFFSPVGWGSGSCSVSFTKCYLQGLRAFWFPFCFYVHIPQCSTKVCYTFKIFSELLDFLRTPIEVWGCLSVILLHVSNFKCYLVGNSSRLLANKQMISFCCILMLQHSVLSVISCHEPSLWPFMCYFSL